MRDIGSLLVWIGVQPGIDRERVVVMGGSYGGYMTLASLVSYGERLKGGIDVAGISDFVSFLRNTSAYRRDLRRAEYGDERDLHMRVFLERISPLPAPPASGSRCWWSRDSTIRACRPPSPSSWCGASAVPAGRSGTSTAKNEGHDFRRKADRDAYLQVAAQFLQKLAH